MKEYTDIEKDFLLVMYRWDKITGWAMDYGAPESQNIIITVDEVRKWIGQKATDYYFPEKDGEYTRDLEEAWECLCDDIYQQNDLKNDTELEAIFDEKLKSMPNSKGDE